VVGVFESEREHEERSRDRAGGDPGRQHSCREGDAALRVGAEDEQVGQVGAGEEEQGRVGHEHRAVQERPLVQPAPPRCVHEHRRQEDDRRIEVEHRGHRRHETEKRQQQTACAEACVGKPGPERLEQAVGGSHGADEQQPGNKYERWPRLAG
jgi:hypothetical protein